jgi:hypothetical protein
MAREIQSNLVADRGLQMEAQVLEITAELIACSQRPVVAVSQITARLIHRYGSEYERPITNRWIGSILRKRFNVRTYKSHGVYVVPVRERFKIEMACRKYGVAPIGEVAGSGDEGTWGVEDADQD